MLNVHDGATLVDPEIGGLAFSSFLRVLPLPIVSTGSDMYLNFITNDVNLGTPLGFNLSFTACMWSLIFMINVRNYQCNISLYTILNIFMFCNI